jgi:hypothetical protein
LVSVFQNPDATLQKCPNPRPSEILAQREKNDRLPGTYTILEASMKFEQLSDFHIEMNVPYGETEVWEKGEPFFYAWHKNKKSNILIIGGDISDYSLRSKWIIEEAARYYDHVLFVDGNHDHYGDDKNPSEHSYENNMDFFRRVDEAHENITFLDGGTGRFQIEDTLFIGANGWYDFQMAYGYESHEQRVHWQRHSKDAQAIRFGEGSQPEMLARIQMESLRLHVEEAQEDATIGNIVITTHTVPHPEGLTKDRTHEWYLLNGAYGNSLMCRVWQADRSKKIKVWTFGHVHSRYDFIIDHIRFIANPRGFRGEIYSAFRGPIQIDTTESLAESKFGAIKNQRRQK